MNVIPDDFFAKINRTIEEANKKQTLIIKAEIEGIKKVIKEEVQKRKEIEQKYNLLKNKCERLEKSLIKNNIIIFGLQQNTEETLVDHIIRSLNTFLDLNLVHSDINDVFTVGKHSQNKPIIVKFTTYIRKKEVLQNCTKLKHVNKNRNPKIIIAEQLSQEGQIKQKVLRKHLSEAKSRKLHAYIKGEKLFINGDPYTVEELQRGNKNTEDIEESTEIEDDIYVRETNSAPATPTLKSKTRETPEEEEEADSCKIATGPRKTKVETGPSTYTRTSSRRQEKEDKNKKSGTPNERKT